MLRIPYRAANFPAGSDAKLSGSHSLHVSWHDIVWAAATVGKGGVTDLIKHGRFSVNETMFRMHLVWANLQQKGSYVYRSDVYLDLDPSEKAAVSYFMGMTVGKLAASELLGVHWMNHLDHVLPRHSIPLKGRSRPDLVGVDALGNWVVLEGKGRSGEFSQPTLDKAKRQAEQISTISGASPIYRIGSQSHFSPHLQIALDDPEEPDEEAIDLPISERKSIETYYRRLSFNEDIEDGDIFPERKEAEFNTFASLGVKIAVDSNVANSIFRQEEARRVTDREKPISNSDTKGSSMEQPFETENEDGFTYKSYPDGVVIGLNKLWSKKSMSKPPRSR